MSSLRKFRDLAIIAIKAALGDLCPDKVKHLDALLTGIAELLDGEDVGRTHQLSTVAEMAFGNPSMMMGSAFDREIPYPVGSLRSRESPPERAMPAPLRGEGPPAVDVRGADSSREPRLIIHESPTIKVTKVGSVPEAQGTTLESLFLGLEPDTRTFAVDEDTMAGVDHESIRSDEVGICCDDEEEEDDDTYPVRPRRRNRTWTTRSW